MRLANIKYNDVVNGEGICVSLWVQGCQFHCKGCHNESTWDFNGGKEAPSDLQEQIVKAISANNVVRNFSVLGGEPLAPQNIVGVSEIVAAVRKAFPQIKIWLWTGYTFEDLLYDRGDESFHTLFNNINVLIDGRYIQEKRDLSLAWRGSGNQRVIDVQKSLEVGEVILYCD